jgi:hypothetical protein
MTPRVRLSPSAGVTPTDEGVILRSDLGTFQITGADAGTFVERVVPLLDGSRDREAIIAALAGYSRPSVTAFLSLLEARGLLEDVPDTTDPLHGPEAFLRAWPAAPRDAMQRIFRARVLSVGLEPWGVAAAIELAAAGASALHLIDAAAATRESLAAQIGEQAPWCRVEESPMEALDAAQVASGSWSLLVAAVPPGDPRLVERVARFAHRAGIVSLWSHLAGEMAVLGPLVTPGRTACRICAAVDALNPPLEGRSPPAPWAGASGQLLGHLVALEALQVISEYTPTDLGGRLLIEDLTTMETTFHTLVRLPRCRVCGVDSAT